jgi:hypothetical protein
MLNFMAMTSTGFPGFHLAMDEAASEGVPPGLARVLSTVLCVRNTPQEPDLQRSAFVETLLRRMYEPFGVIQQIRVMSQFSFVKFDHRANAERAMVETEGAFFEGRSLEIKWGRGQGIEKDDFDQDTGTSLSKYPF